MNVVCLVDQDGHADVGLRSDLGGRLAEVACPTGRRRSPAGAPWILHDRPARRLVQRHRAVRVLDAVALEDLEALLLPGAGDAEDRDLLGRVVAELDARLDHAPGDDVHPGVGDDRHHHRDLVHAGLLEHELGQPARLAHARVAADLAVVGRVAAVGADRVEQRERAAAGADDQPEVAVELGHVAGHAAVILGVDLLAGELERSGLARQPRLLVADPELVQKGLLPGPGLVLHVHVGVERDERAVLESRRAG